MADKGGVRGRGPVGILLAAGLKRREQALECLRTAWRWSTDREIRAALRGLIVGLAGCTQLIRSNTVRGLLAGEVALSERTLNRWFSRIAPPQGISAMSLRCHPSRLVLVLRFDRRLLGFYLGHETIELPFELVDAFVNYRGGRIELYLDREGFSQERGFVRPFLARMLAPEAAELLESPEPLTQLDRVGAPLHRDGDTLLVDLGRYPPFLDLMNRELPLASGRSLFPFRAFSVHRIQVKEGKLALHMHFHTECILEDDALQETEQSR